MHVQYTCCMYSVYITIIMLAGYGFVDFESPEAAKKACQNLTLQGTQASFAKVCFLKIS